jgi:hypothetical protein
MPDAGQSVWALVLIIFSIYPNIQYPFSNFCIVLLNFTMN